VRHYDIIKRVGFMPMNKISIKEVKRIAEQYGLTPIKVKGTGVVNISKNPSERYVKITWEEFEAALKEKDIAVYKTAESDFLKIMKNKK